MNKVLIASQSFGKSSNEPWDVFKNAGIDLIVNDRGKPYTEDELLKLVKDVNGIVAGVDPITARVINAAPKLKVIAKHGVGVDNIDLNEATERRIYVTVTPGANTQAVADLTFGLILGAARKIVAADCRMRRGEWPRFVGIELWQKTIGIVGLGQIGRAVARRARGFDMRVLAYDVKPDLDFCRREDIELCGIEKLLKESDIISLHAPLNSETSHLINRETLSWVKDGVIIVNTARGELIDIDALYDALLSKKVVAAGLDVYSPEPPDITHPIFKLENVVLTPHLGAYTREANRMMGMLAAQSVVDVLNGHEPRYWINKF
ncbi:MAG: hypothetical protein PWR06_727 [Thermoanaerobacteraceae bacterium]|jgi:D-3-phosphoglycerate dehydrogenase|nr:hypothetical protein [Thermoanaerobacteraceae bacterium]